jgi:hypothetical protein
MLGSSRKRNVAVLSRSAEQLLDLLSLTATPQNKFRRIALQDAILLGAVSKFGHAHNGRDSKQAKNARRSGSGSRTCARIQRNGTDTPADSARARAQGAWQRMISRDGQRKHVRRLTHSKLNTRNPVGMLLAHCGNEFAQLNVVHLNLRHRHRPHLPGGTR